MGIPPGFDLLSEDLQEYQEKSSKPKSGRLEKFSQTATQAILYCNAFAAGEAVQLKFRLRANYSIRTQTFRSRVYEYYDPDVRSVARPVSLEVAKQGPEAAHKSREPQRSMQQSNQVIRPHFPGESCTI